VVLLKRERVKLRSFGEKLKRIRTKCGLTQDKFADEMNISLDTVKNWEQGYNYPSIDMLVSISEYFKCDLDYLIG
jgi:transcriptional regulator with XRE-family HTH domain